MFSYNNKDLNNEQINVVNERQSLLLIACPGSGKTRTLTYKIANELSHLQSQKQYIIAITYTNTAAEEIKERIELLGVNTSQLWIGTIHAFCSEWILKPYYHNIQKLKYGYSIIDSHESDEIIIELCKPFKDKKITLYDCGFSASISGIIKTSKDSKKHKFIDKVLSEYFSILKNEKKINYEQILYFSYELLNNYPIIKKILSKIIPYIFIDEYQDTKDIQYHILTTIINTGKGNTKTLIVGDPNQSIYETLGGFPLDKQELEKLIGFELLEYSLTQNYRSSSSIIDYFDYYKIFNNTITPNGINKDYRSIITYNKSIDCDELDNEIVRLIEYNIKELNISPNEICIAGPQWFSLARLTRTLMAKMPDYSFNGPGMAPFSRDVDNFWVKLSRIILTEPSPNLYLKRLRWAKEIIDRLDEYGIDISKITSKSFLRLCNGICIDKIDGIKYLELFFAEIFKKLNIDPFLYSTLSMHYKTFFDSSKKRIEKLEKSGITGVSTIESFKKVFKQKNGIKVSTIHGIKGEEYDTVIGFGLLDSWIPHFSDTNGKINSKKLLYVLCSRARKNLHLISESGRNKSYYRPLGLQPTSHLDDYNYEYSMM